MKKTLSIFLGLLLLAAPGAVQAQFTYNTNANNTINITGYTGPPGVMTIPATINGLPVTSIGVNAFAGEFWAPATNLTSVIIGTNVTSIGESAFFENANLSSVTIPSSVISIGSEAFEGTALTNVTIPVSVAIIGDSAFWSCTNLTTITVSADNLLYSSLNGVLFDKSQDTLIQYPGGGGGSYAVPGNVTSIESGAFSGSGLTSVIIPASVTSIEPAAFEGCNNLTNATIPGGVTILSYELFTDCPSLTSVYFQGNAPAAQSNPFLGPPAFGGDTNATVYYLPGTTGWSSNFDGCSAVQSAETAPSQFSCMTNAGAITIAAYTGSGGSVIIPRIINGLPVTAIGANAFYYCTNLSSIALLGSISSIGVGAFEGCTNLIGAVMSPGVASIGDNAFEGCTSMPSIAIPASVTSIGNNAFASCSSLLSLYFFGNAPSAGQGIFNNDNITKIYYLPCGTGWGLTFAGIPAVPQTPIDQLNYESYNGIVVLTGYNSGPCGALVIPATIDGWPVIYIEEPGDNPPPAFARGNTNLTSVTIPGSIASVTAEAFEDCTTLRSVTMDYGVTSIGQWAFSGCTSLTNISIAASVTNIGWFVFDGCSRLTSLPNGVTIYGDGEFSGTGLTNITIPSTVANIPFFAFGQCGNLTNVTILCGVTNIDSSAFYGDPLTSVTFPDSVTSIGGSAYYLCESLTNVVIPASVTQIGSQAFGYADKLTNILFLGNAPAQTADQGGAFASDLGATLYYLPGTTGWTTQFSEATNVLWNPTIQTSGASFGVHSNQFGFNITGTSNIPIAVEACTNLAKPVWTPLTNVTLSNGLFYFSDAQWTNYPGRFYGIGFP